MKKNNFSDSGVKVDYIEEVDEKQLFDKKSYSDIIYVNSKSSFVKRVLFIIFLFVFILLILFLSIFGFSFFNKNVVDEEYSLFLTHSNPFYGGENLIISDFNSIDDAYSYSFTVNNSNDVSLSYKVQVENVNYGFDNVEYTNINYSLLKYNDVVSSGVLEDKAILDIANIDISSNSNHQLTLKIWSNINDENLEYSFKVKILV